MTEAQIQEEIATLEKQIEDNKLIIAEMVGVAVEELDLANLPTEGLNEEQLAQLEELVKEINGLYMRIEALKERLGNASADNASAFKEGGI